MAVKSSLFQIFLINYKNLKINQLNKIFKFAKKNNYLL